MDHFEHNSNNNPMTELVSSLESMNVNGTNPYSHHHATVNMNVINMKIPMVDLNFNNHPADDPPQFILSPSTPTPSKILNTATAAPTTAATKYYNDSGLPGIDLGWVNDLLT